MTEISDVVLNLNNGGFKFDDFDAICDYFGIDPIEVKKTCVEYQEDVKTVTSNDRAADFAVGFLSALKYLKFRDPEKIEFNDGFEAA